MSLDQYISNLRDRAEEAEKVSATAPMHKVYERIADELEHTVVDDLMKAEYMTTKRAQKISGYSRQHIRDLCRKGLVYGAVKPSGGEWRIPVGAMRAYMERNKTCMKRAGNLPSAPSLLS